MYNLYDKYLRGNSIGCCPLYVSYYLLYTLKLKLMYLRGNSIGTDDDGRRRRHTFNLSNRQADRGFATSRLITRSDEDGAILAHNKIHGSDWYIEKGGERSAGSG